MSEITENVSRGTTLFGVSAHSVGYVFIPPSV